MIQWLTAIDSHYTTGHTKRDFLKSCICKAIPVSRVKRLVVARLACRNNPGEG